MANEAKETAVEELIQLCHSSECPSNGSNVGSALVCQQRSNPSVARLRWKILSKALDSTEAEVDLGSVRRFESFGLIELKDQPIHKNESTLGSDIESHINKDLLDGKWFECRLWNHSDNAFDNRVVEIRLLAERIPIYELLHSFDNTGNVCLWPSEEVLSYYSYKNRNLSFDKTVLELGGGMTSLCGLVTAVFASAKQVILTDGNERCISNVRAIVDRNRHRLGSVVSCRRLKWGESSHFADLIHRIDLIFCSDCIYFDESRHLLVDTIHKLLKSTGIAIVLAPTRGSTFDNFVDLAKHKFELKIIENYDQIVYELHKNFVKTADKWHYIPDLHFPVMIELRNKSKV